MRYGRGVSPRRSVADTRDTHHAIVRRAMDVASVAGLDGLSIGGLASDLGMSKAGVAGHFANKQQLQLEAIDGAVELFTATIAPSLRERTPGLDRLRAGVEAWFAYLEDNPFPGGCLIQAAAAEQDGRPGPVRDAVVAADGQWRAFLLRELRTAIEAGELPADTDAGQRCFVLLALGAGLNQAVQLRADPQAGDRARRAARALLDR